MKARRMRWLRILMVVGGLYLLFSCVVLFVLHERAHETLETDQQLPNWKQVSRRAARYNQIRRDKQQNAQAIGSGEKEKRLNAKAPDSSSLQKPHQSPVAHLPNTKIQQPIEKKPWQFDRSMAEQRLKTDGASSIRQPITAYLEKEPYPPPDYILSIGSRGDMKKDKDFGKPPVYKYPLPLRTQTPTDLQKVVYKNVQTCHDMPQGFPVDRGLELDDEGKAIVWNVGDKPTPPDFPQQELPYCPVEADPFLPWIHDLFPSPDGKHIHILAQNKRRCRTGQKFTENVQRLLPQVALMQPISVQRLTSEKAQSLAPSLWSSGDATRDEPRYRLVPLDQASRPDGEYTRFICRFHSLDFETGQPIVVGETLSMYPFNYELAAYRKGHAVLHTPKGKDSRFFWTSNIRFTCPVPESLQSLVAKGEMVLSDGTPTLWLDVVPIRTPVRYQAVHLGEELVGPQLEAENIRRWNVTEELGDNHVVPAVEASGRWANLPICAPYKPDDVDSTTKAVISEGAEVSETSQTTEKPHYLSACLWASAQFNTRGQKRGANSDTTQRLFEWLTFHFMVGFDHVYVYDNSGANTNSTNLEPILRHFGDRVTRIDWPSIVCNNNIPAHDSTGERSSQYAAENSCRTRYGPYTEWIASFDTDEYFVPMGKYTNLKEVLQDAKKSGANILSFRSSRGRLRQEATTPDGEGRVQLPNTTFLEAYNCDSAGTPKPSWADRARKQIYRPDYVYYHFVHYSTVTAGYMKTYTEGQTHARFREHQPSERVVDENNEAVLVHTKSIPKDMTNFYNTRCRNDYGKKWQGCWVGYPWPNDVKGKIVEDENGMEYNCFINRKVEDYWVPRLREALKSTPFSLS